MIRVYFEPNNGVYADHIATFYNEDAYDAAIAGLEKWARENNGHITESVITEELT